MVFLTSMESQEHHAARVLLSPTGEAPHMPSQIKRVKVGEAFEIALHGNPTTGFRWDFEIEPTLTDRIALLEEGWQPATPDVGASGVQRFRFQAFSPGEVTCTFRYRRPWEKGKVREENVYTIYIGTTH